MASEKLRKFGMMASSAAISLSRPNYFESNNIKGEEYELKVDLSSEITLVRKEAIKKIIAGMSLGRESTSLFPDVIKCIQTEDLELKKLVYLYLINYAKSQPELAILAINTFVKDSGDSNPLIRALAIRTMGCIHVERVVDFLMDPLKKTLKDSHPYVRKTAVICVLKAYTMAPNLVKEHGLLDILKSLLDDPNVMVLANVIATIKNIHSCELERQRNASPIVHIDKNEANHQNNQSHQNSLPFSFNVDTRLARRLLTALNDCSEWSQLIFLEILCLYSPSSEDEAEFAIEQLYARLQHVNPSVVLTTIKVILIYIDCLANGHAIKDQALKKLTAPLVTLISNSSIEVEYVALKSIKSILAIHPHFLSSSAVKLFFCKYNEPLYVKYEKLNLICQQTNNQNYPQVIQELAEYCKEVDMEWVKYSLNSSHLIALKVPESNEAIRNLYEDLLFNLSEQSFIIQQVSIAIYKILKSKRLKSFESLIPKLINLYKDEIFNDNSDAKQAILWLISSPSPSSSSFSSLSPAKLKSLMDRLVVNFSIDSPKVEMEILKSLSKCYLNDPTLFRSSFKKLIEQAKVKGITINIRDRACMYERMLELNIDQLQEELSRAKEREKRDIEYKKEDEEIKWDTFEPIKDGLLESLNNMELIYHDRVLPTPPPQSFPFACQANNGIDGNINNIERKRKGIVNPNKEKNQIIVTDLLNLDNTDIITDSSKRISDEKKDSVPFSRQYPNTNNSNSNSASISPITAKKDPFNLMDLLSD